MRSSKFIQSARSLLIERYGHEVGALRPEDCPRTPRNPTSATNKTNSELGLAVILTPLVLRCNAREDWIRPTYYGAKAVSTLAFLQPANGESAMSPLDFIVCAYSVFSAAVSAVSTHTYMPTSGCHSEWSLCFPGIDQNHKLQHTPFQRVEA